jgi:hypothetical protein
VPIGRCGRRKGNRRVRTLLRRREVRRTIFISKGILPQDQSTREAGEVERCLSSKNAARPHKAQYPLKSCGLALYDEGRCDGSGTRKGRGARKVDKSQEEKKKATENNVKKNLGTHIFLKAFDACHDNLSCIVDV